MFRPMIALSLLALMSTAAAAALPQCLDQLDGSVTAIGTPGSVEARTELDQLRSAVSVLRSQWARLSDDKGSIDDARRRFERDIRYRDDRMRQLEFEQRVHNEEGAQLRQRSQALVAESARQRAAAAAANTAAAAASVRAWKADGERRQAVLEGQIRDWRQRNGELQQRRQDLLADAAAQAQRLGGLQQRSAAVERQIVLVDQQCAALGRRLLAFRQIAGISRPSSVHYPADQKPAGDLVAGLLRSGAADLTTGAIPRLYAIAKSSPLGFRALTKAAGVLGIAYTAADLFMDVTIAAMAPREREVVRNIYLIGDYSYVLRLMAAEQGPSAFQTAEYLAIRSELERLQREMPRDKYDFMRQSLGSYEGVVEAFKGVAAQYAGKKAGNAMASLRQYSGPERQVLGPAGVAFFGGVLRSTGKIFVPQLAGSAEKDVGSFIGEPRSDVPPAAAAYPADASPSEARP